MRLTDQHKALLITFFLSGTVVLSVFNLSLNQKDVGIAETFYDIEAEEELTEEELKVLEAVERLNGSKAETNKAFNESQKNSHFAEAYKPIAPPEDYVPKSTTDSEAGEKYTKIYENTDDSRLNSDELSSFSKVNDLLKKQNDESNNTKSTMSYSLVDRKLLNNPTPIYLCENGGKIVVNISVNGRGEVTDAYINSSSTSSNECLTQHALEYAKQALFNSASKASQIGSITFLFIGKH